MRREEAEQITNEARKFKGWRKLRLIWICGRFNGEIKHAAKKGRRKVLIQKSHGFADSYYKTLSKIYKEQGFDVWYETGYTYSNVFEIKW